MGRNYNIKAEAAPVLRTLTILALALSPVIGYLTLAFLIMCFHREVTEPVIYRMYVGISGAAVLIATVLLIWRWKRPLWAFAFSTIPYLPLGLTLVLAPLIGLIFEYIVPLFTTN